MPCYDKKLEASREDFYNDIYRTRDVDCVISTGINLNHSLSVLFLAHNESLIASKANSLVTSLESMKQCYYCFLSNTSKKQSGGPQSKFSLIHFIHLPHELLRNYFVKLNKL